MDPAARQPCGVRELAKSWRVTPFHLLACMSLQGLGLVAERSFFPHYDPQWAELVRSRRGDLDPKPNLEPHPNPNPNSNPNPNPNPNSNAIPNPNPGALLVSPLLAPLGGRATGAAALVGKLGASSGFIQACL